MIGGTFEGKLSEDGKTITGTWTQGTQPLPLTLVRATPETAWDNPAPPPPKRIPADASHAAHSSDARRLGETKATSLAKLLPHLLSEPV